MSQTHSIEGIVSGLVKQFASRSDSVLGELNRLAGVRRRTISLVSGVTTAQADFTPRQNAWSVAQVLDHILLFEGLYRDAIERLIELGKQGKPTKITYSMRDIDVSVAALPQSVLTAMEAPLNVM